MKICRIAVHATQNHNSIEVIGKFNADGVSYVEVAKMRGATYFQLENWDDVATIIGEENMWNINELFLKQQMLEGKTFFLSHNPAKATGYFAQEVNFLKSNGYRFIKERSLWRAVK